MQVRREVILLCLNLHPDQASKCRRRRRLPIYGPGGVSELQSRRDMMRAAMEKTSIKDLDTPRKPAPTKPVPVNGKTAAVRHASKDDFEKARRKTTAQHAGLFRQLAK